MNRTQHIGQPVVPRSFHIMTKPIGPLCNLDCNYCFYLEKEKLFSREENYKMRDKNSLDNFIAQNKNEVELNKFIQW